MNATKTIVDARTEIAQLEGTLVGLLAEVVAQFDRIDQLVGNASHTITPRFSQAVKTAIRAEVQRLAVLNAQPPDRQAEQRREVERLNLQRDHLKAILHDREEWEHHISVKHQLVGLDAAIERAKQPQL